LLVLVITKIRIERSSKAIKSVFYVFVK
jgi:hypothetical protein